MTYNRDWQREWARKRRQDPVKREMDNAARRKRERELYANDPAFRSRKKARAAADYEAHKEQRLAFGKAWAEANHDKVIRMARERYWRTDPRKRFAWRADRTASEYGRPDDKLDWENIPEGPWSCTYCGVACESWDHVERLAAGGTNRASNLVPSCVPCNQKRNGGPWQLRRKPACRYGHEFTPENTRIGSKGERRCRACARRAAA